MIRASMSRQDLPGLLFSPGNAMLLPFRPCPECAGVSFATHHQMSKERKEMIRLTWKRFRGAIRMLIESEQGPKAMMCA